MTGYSINPCKAADAKVKLGYSKGGIHDMNSTCFSTCSAFGESTKNSECAHKCTDFIDKIKIQNGGNKCYPQVPYKPAMWNQTPHYFPQLLWEHKNVNKAKEECYKFCGGETITKNSCLIACQTDAAAIEDPVTVEKYKHNRRHCIPNNNKNITRYTYDDYAKSNPTPFYIGFGIMGFISIFIIYFVIQSLFINKK